MCIPDVQNERLANGGVQLKAQADGLTGILDRHIWPPRFPIRIQHDLLGREGHPRQHVDDAVKAHPGRQTKDGGQPKDDRGERVIAQLVEILFDLELVERVRRLRKRVSFLCQQLMAANPVHRTTRRKDEPDAHGFT